MTGASALVAVGSVAAVAAEPTPTCVDGTCTATYGYTGGPQTFTVPAGVTSVVADVRGARGGSPNAGLGGATVATIAVTPGEALRLVVGQAGGGGNNAATYGGGGGAFGDAALVGSGGGGSFLSTGSTLLLAAGGGGGGQAYSGSGGGQSAGGGTSGGSGGSIIIADFYSHRFATGGTQSTGGAGGLTTVYGTPREPGQPGSGPATASQPGVGGTGSRDNQQVDNSGGGGGGGYYGGGGGSYVQSGAGGSGYIASSSRLSSTSTSSGVRDGAGVITLAWADDLLLSPTSPASATVGSPYSQNLVGTGGVAPYTFAITSGALPAGVTLTTSGLLSGRPTAGGTFTFTVRLTDGRAATYTRAYSLVVAAPTTTLQPSSLSSAAQGADYSQALTASGGIAPYRFTITAGAVPPGVTLTSNGILSGRPTASGTFNFTVTSRDSSTGTGPYLGSRAYSLAVDAPAPVADPQSVSTRYQTATAITLTGSSAANPPRTLTYTVTTGPRNGTLSGTAPNLTFAPSAGYSGPDSFTFTVNDGSRTSAVATVSITVGAPAPTVTGVSPPRGPVSGGQVVTITGTNLTGATNVSFDGAPAAGVTVVSPTQITARTPANRAGVVDVTVTTDGGTGSSRGAYTFVSRASLVSLSPTAGPETGGTQVVITGTDLGGATAVTFGGRPATSFTVDSPTQITAVAPAGTGSARVEVVTPGGTSTSTADSYDYVAAPIVTGLSPSAGPTSGGTTVTIAGTGFRPGASVAFGGVAATDVNVVSGTQITATAPEGTGTTNVSVRTPGGTGTLAGAYTYVAAPTLTDLSSTVGPQVGGATVVLTGTHLDGATVRFGAGPVTVTGRTATTVTVITPPGTGVVDVSVTTAGGTDTLRAAYVYARVPTVTQVSPDRGPETGGTTVTITGTDFRQGATVTFGGTAATQVTVDSATRIVATAPPGTGTANVGVSTPGGTGTLTGAYTYVARPSLASITPGAGPETGGTRVVLTGTHLNGTTDVTFGGRPASSFTVDSSTQITAVTPAGTGSARVEVVTTGGRSASSASAFQYVAEPTVTGLAPSEGPETGGNDVTIAGTDLSRVSAVRFGTTPATDFEVVDDRTVVAVAPSGTGTVDVVVTGVGGTSADTGSDDYTYVTAPALAELSSKVGPEVGGATVTLTGTHLEDATISFGSRVASVTSRTATTVTVTTPAGTGNVDVTVTTAGGSDTLDDAYTYVGVPTVTVVSPDRGPEAGGTTVTLTGTDFRGLSGTGAVKFGDTDATSWTVDSPTSLTAVAPAGNGTVDVTVTNPAGTSAASSDVMFTYVPAPKAVEPPPPAAPSVTGISRGGSALENASGVPSGPRSGGARIRITGSGLSAVTGVSFGSVPAHSFVVVSDRLVTAVAPAGRGTVDVRLTVASSDLPIRTGVRFSYRVRPKVSGLSRELAPRNGGAPVVITGRGFTDIRAVVIGGRRVASYEVLSRTRIRLVLPPRPRGTAMVRVVTAGGWSKRTPNAAIDYRARTR